MDPQTALNDLMDAIHRNDREAASNSLEALRGWINRGGFLPTVERHNNNAFVVRRRVTTNEDNNKHE